MTPPSERPDWFERYEAFNAARKAERDRVDAERQVELERTRERAAAQARRDRELGIFKEA